MSEDNDMQSVADGLGMTIAEPYRMERVEPAPPHRTRVNVKVDRFRELPESVADQPYPAYASDGALAFDLRALEFLEENGAESGGIEQRKVAPGMKCWIGTGLRFALPRDWGLSIIPRSGLGAKAGLVLANGTGLIDSDYRGEVLVCLWNRTGMHHLIDHGQRIAQARLVCSPQAAFEFTSDLDNTVRDSGGFGSTGSR